MIRLVSDSNVLLKINYCCLWSELFETQTNTPCLYNAGISVWMQVGNPVNTLLYLFQMCTKWRRGEARWGAAMWCTTFNVIGGQRGFYCLKDPRHWPRRPSGKCRLNTRWSAGKWSRADEKMLGTWEGFGVWSAGLWQNLVTFGGFVLISEINVIIFTNLVPISQKTHSVFLTKTKRLVLFREVSFLHAGS